MNIGNIDIKIGSTSEWKQLFDMKMDMIVDPMIFRVGDVFLRGRTMAMKTLSSKDPDRIMSAITGDVGSLISFFDQLVMAEALPVIDYGITFDSTLKYDTPWICQQVNQVFGEKVLWTVHVNRDASEEARTSALQQLPACPRPAGELEASVRNHLNALDYEWRPSLDSMEAQLSKAQLVPRRRDFDRLERRQ
jgi:hypothetical protein